MASTNKSALDADGNPLAAGDAVELVSVPSEHPWGHLDGRRGVVHAVPDYDDPNVDPDYHHIIVTWVPENPYDLGVSTLSTHFRKVDKAAS